MFVRGRGRSSTSLMRMDEVLLRLGTVISSVLINF